ncbi:hypothetical protein NLI96_g5095 [Meripilus lineatus]|uniref:UspA domain-containing protein n=1 Tax=Meripilus lineatus TaxID=2056292 RepID=A0AAD5V3E6_9APHY|nr:hypothetical protein NLI96_g5095 [Physisporinus lineatus]
MSDRTQDKPSKRRSWIPKYGSSREKDTRKSDSLNSSTSALPVPQEGQPLSYDHPLNALSTANRPASTITSGTSSAPPTRPTTPTFSPFNRRWSSATASSSVLTSNDIDTQAARLNALSSLERTTSTVSAREHAKLDKEKTPSTSSFSRRSISSMMSGFPSLYLTRSNTDDKERGRSQKKDKDSNHAHNGSGGGSGSSSKGKMRSSSYAGSRDDDNASESGSIRARSVSPFHFRSKNRRDRDASPTVEALSQSDVESDAEEVSRIRPRNAFTLSANSDADDDDSLDEDEQEGDGDEDDSGDEDSWSESEGMDPLTTANTERNALIPADAITAEPDSTDVPDPLGEGVNVVIAPEPYFPTTLNYPTRNPRRRKSTRTQLQQERLHLETSRPAFQRDRCTITLVHGEPANFTGEGNGNGRRGKRYVLASDLSEESRYALEWGIGTVLRDGDEMLIVTVVENETKVDPLIPNPADRTAKLRAQQERQALAYILVRQATSLLQRTRLHVTIACQAWHAKNSRHMLLDIVDYVEPTMLIVGSRGLGNLKGYVP